MHGNKNIRIGRDITIFAIARSALGAGGTGDLLFESNTF
jgi:hypothetical protein